MTKDLSDTSTWLPLDGLEPGFDAGKPATTSALDGRTIAVVQESGTVVEHTFSAGRVDWRYLAANDDAHGNAEASDPCEVFEIDRDLYYAQFHTTAPTDDGISLIVDLRTGRALNIVTFVTEDGHPRVQQAFVPCTIRGMEQSGEAPAPSDALIGRRAMWRYSEQHVYEHVYLSNHWYTWQCLAGPERGLADTDEASVWELRPGIYVFAWREKVIPCASVTVADHRNFRAMTSVGALFGMAEDGVGHTHFTFGATGKLLSTTVHPSDVDPADIEAAGIEAAQ